MQIAYVSHTAKFSEMQSREILQWVSEWGYKINPRCRVDPKRRAVSQWHLEGSRGYFKASSTGAALAGHGFDLIICDDLVKNHEQVTSPDQREKTWSWWISEVKNRCHPGGKILNLMARRHPDDILGRLLNSNDYEVEDLKWHTVRYPALEDEDGPNPQALWPQEWPVHRLLAEKHSAEQGGKGYIWRCLYQQDATGDPDQLAWPESYFKSIYYDEGMQPTGPAVKLKLMAMDPSVGRRANSGDFVCILSAIWDGYCLWIEDIFLQRMPISQAEDFAVEQCRQYQPNAFFVETNAWQITVAQNMVDKAAARGVYLPIWPEDSKIDKNVRINMTLTHMLEHKRVKIKRSLASSSLLVKQMREWPTGSHDDGVDCLSLLVVLINRIQMGEQ